MEHNELARSEIVSMTHMSFPTVSKNVDFLLSRNILLERGESESTASGLGRKRKKLAFNASAYTALAVHFEGQVVETATIDLSGKVLAYESHQLPDLRDPLSQHALGKTLRRQLESAHSPVLGVGFAFPADIDPETNEIVSFHALGIDRPVAINDVLSPLFSEFKANAYCGNDVNLAAEGEMLSQKKKGQTCNLCYLSLGSGFGSGIILNGKLLNGATYKAGEIGNTLVRPSIDTKGHFETQLQPLEDFINVKAILARFGVNLIHENNLQDSMKKMIIDFILPFLIMAVVNMTFLFDIQEYILSGVIPKTLGPTLVCRLEQSVNRILEGRGRTIHVTSPSSNYSTLIGCASLVFEQRIVDGLNKEVTHNHVNAIDYRKRSQL